MQTVEKAQKPECFNNKHREPLSLIHVSRKYHTASGDIYASVTHVPCCYDDRETHDNMCQLHHKAAMVFTSYLRPSQAPSVAPSVAPSRGRTSPMRSPTPIRGSVPPTERGHRDNLTNGAMLSGTPASRTRRDTSNHRGLSAGIDLALLALSEEVRCSARFYRDFYQDFEQQTAGLKEWVEDSTLDILWKDRVKYKFHARGESERLRSMVDRVRRCQEAVKDAIESTGGGRSSATDAKYQMEHQVHTAKKALVYCEVLAELIERAAEERIACKYLVSELEEARNLLNRKRHPWICKCTHLTSNSSC